MRTAPFAAETDWHQHCKMSATPCLHICSCSDRNNTRPSLLHPYLGSYLSAGPPWGERTSTFTKEENLVIDFQYVQSFQLNNPIVWESRSFTWLGKKAYSLDSLDWYLICHVYVFMSLPTICLLPTIKGRSSAYKLKKKIFKTPSLQCLLLETKIKINRVNWQSIKYLLYTHS